MASIKNKQKASANFVGSAPVGIKSVEKTVYSKRAGKNVKVTDRTGALTLSDGTFLKFKLNPTTDAKFKESGISFWLEVAEFAPNGGGSNGGR